MQACSVNLSNAENKLRMHRVIHLSLVWIIQALNVFVKNYKDFHTLTVFVKNQKDFYD